MTAERRRALITGLTGQDGSFLAEQLLADGYAVTGLVQDGAGRDLGSAAHLAGQVDLVAGDLLAPRRGLDRRGRGRTARSALPPGRAHLRP